LSIKLSNVKFSKVSKSYNIRRNKGNVNDNISDNETSGAYIWDYKYLEGSIHRDDEDLKRYITDRVYIDKHYRAWDPSSLHVQCLVEMTKKDIEESLSRKFRTFAAILLKSGYKELLLQNKDVLGYGLQGDLLNRDSSVTDIIV